MVQQFYHLQFVIFLLIYNYLYFTKSVSDQYASQLKLGTACKQLQINYTKT